jgi:hypothetical protein
VWEAAMLLLIIILIVQYFLHHRKSYFFLSLGVFFYIDLIWRGGNVPEPTEKRSDGVCFQKKLFV